MTPLRVMVVDDSAQNREQITALLSRSSLATVVAVAEDGAEALTLLNDVLPDAVVLDLEMPRIDGYTFLRLLMSTRPLPVIVVSGHSRKENVFHALELGALDFVAKSDALFDPDFERELLEKLDIVRRARSPVRSRASLQPVTPAQLGRLKLTPERVVVFAASTGGPSTLSSILTRLEAPVSYAVLIAQHMPARFTATLAERLDRLTHFEVSEPEDGEMLYAGRAFVCPGDRCMELWRNSQGGLQVRILRPLAEERYVPNASRLFESVARAAGRNALGVVLTGMGDDGARGAAAIAAAGGEIVVESEESAVVYGMPAAAKSCVPGALELPSHRIHEEIQRSVAAGRR